MADRKPGKAADILQLNHYARSIYGDWSEHAEDVAKLFTGEYKVTPDVQDGSIEIVNSAKARNIFRKKMSMLAIRSHKAIEVAAHSAGTNEARKVDKLERACHAYLKAIEHQTQADPFHDAAFFAMYRGRGGLLTTYNPLSDGMLRLNMRALDSLTYFPVRSDHQIEWFTMDYYKSRMEMIDWLMPFEDGRFAEAQRVMGRYDQGSYSENVHVVEYWDQRWNAYVIDDVLVGPFEHDYGFVPLVDIEINQTPLRDKRWASEGALGGVEDELKNYNVLLSKMATAVSTMFWPKVLVQTEDGNLVMLHTDGPFDPVPIPEGATVQVINPQPDWQTLNMLRQAVETEIQKGTISDQVYNLQTPDVSGFLHQQVQAQIMDAVADEQHPLQRGFALALSHFLRLAEQFAPAQPGGAWDLPLISGDGRRVVEKLTADDIDGHYDVTVNIKLQHPTDKLQLLTAANQARGVGPDGRPLMDWRTAFEISGLGEMVENVSEVERRRDFEFLVNADPEVQQLYLASLKASNRDVLEEMRKEAEKDSSRMMRKAEKQEERAIERGESQGAILPPEFKNNPQMLQQLAGLVAQGIPFEQAMATLQKGDLPLGVPGQPQQGGGDFTDILQAFKTPQPQPDGLTGYEGLDPTAMPAPLAGAQPRQSVDKAQLALEEIEQDMRRGGLPAPK